MFEEEPAVNPRLLKLARQHKVVLLPHMGSATQEGRVDMGEKVIVNIKSFIDGHKPPDRVLPEHAVMPPSSLTCRARPSVRFESSRC